MTHSTPPRQRPRSTALIAAPLTRTRLLASPVLRFLAVGALSTVGYLALYALLRLQLPAQAANLVALLATGDVNTVLNRRWSFRLTGPTSGAERAKGVAAYLVSLVATSGSLGLLTVLGVQGTAAELGALVAANALAGVVHYVLLRRWAFRRGGEAATCPVRVSA